MSFGPLQAASGRELASFAYAGEGKDSGGKSEKQEKNDGDHQKKVGYRVLDWDQNRYVVGDPRRFHKPAEVNLSEVLALIPAYQQIVKEKLTDKDPRYYFLMTEATQALVKAVETVTRKTGHDLVADVGAVQADGAEMTNLTDSVTEILKK